MTKKKKKDIKQPRWKREQYRKKKSILWEKISQWLRVVILLIFLALVFLGYRLFVGGVWKGDERFTVVVADEQNEEVGIVSLDPIEQEVQVFVMPGNVMVEATYGYGEYRVGALLPLGELEGLGVELMRSSIQELFGLYVQEVVVYNLSGVSESPALWLKGVSNSMIWQAVKGEMSFTDAIRFMREISKVRSDKADVIEMGSSRLVRKIIQPDGEEAVEVDKLRLDGFLKTRVTSLLYVREGLRLAVVNTTGEMGLAASVARILTNSGIDVVAIADNDNALDKTIILTADKEYKVGETGRFLEMVFASPKWEVIDTSDYRTDVVILLGMDYWEYYNEKPTIE